MFGITTIADYLQKIEEDVAAFRADIDNPGLALNCVLWIHHLHDWVWCLSIGNNKDIRESLNIHSLPGFRDWLKINCQYFDLMGELANGAKHFKLDRPPRRVPKSERVAGYGQGPYGVGPYGRSYLLIDCGDDASDGERWLVGHSVIFDTFSFWKEFIQKHNLATNA